MAQGLVSTEAGGRPGRPQGASSLSHLQFAHDCASPHSHKHTHTHAAQCIFTYTNTRTHVSTVAICLCLWGSVLVGHKLRKSCVNTCPTALGWIAKGKVALPLEDERNTVTDEPAIYCYDITGFPRVNDEYLNKPLCSGAHGWQQTSAQHKAPATGIEPRTALFVSSSLTCRARLRVRGVVPIWSAAPGRHSHYSLLNARVEHRTNKFPTNSWISRSARQPPTSQPANTWMRYSPLRLCPTQKCVRLGRHMLAPVRAE